MTKLYAALRSDLRERLHTLIEDEDGNAVNSTVRLVTESSTTEGGGTDEFGFPIPESEQGPTEQTLSDPIPAWVDYESGTERLANDSLEQDQGGTVQVSYERAQALDIGAEDILSHKGKRLYIHSTNDLHQGGVILELTVTRTGETA